VIEDDYADLEKDYASLRADYFEQIRRNEQTTKNAIMLLAILLNKLGGRVEVTHGEVLEVETKTLYQSQDVVTGNLVYEVRD
jgi:hypothetical protein